VRGMDRVVPRVAVLVVAASGGVWAGCGASSTTNSIRREANNAINKADEKANEAINKTRNQLNEAQGKVNEAARRAKEQLHKPGY
jgi:hypothetical protein